MITSRSNQKLKMVRKLLESSRERRSSGMFAAEGERLCREVPGRLLVSVIMSEDYYRSQGKDAAFLSGVPADMIDTVDNALFRSLSDTVNPQGIMAVVRQPEWKDMSDTDTKGKMLLLDGIRDPGNLGTIIRTAEAAGVKAVFMSSDCVDLYNPKVIRSTMGSIFRVPAITADLEKVIEKLRKAGKSVYGTSLSASKSYRETDLSDAAIIIGSEANGAKPQILAAASECIKIPMSGEVESLNAAISAAILMFS